MKSTKNTEHLKFIELLNANHQWPTNYLFKFIGTPEDTKGIVSYFSDDAIIKTKMSSNGKYLSISIWQKVKDAEEVLHFYQLAKSNHKNIITI